MSAPRNGPIRPGLARDGGSELPVRAPGASRISWHSVDVDGHKVRYGLAGTGPAALFLHGWGLRPNGYRPPIQAMADAGCRVYAPSLPGFGGTPELPPDRRSFPGYATWVGRFFDAVGEDEAAVVAGHSFGGGVATAFTYEEPWRVSSLLLANPIGSPTWALLPNGVRTMGQRPMWDWTRHIGTDLLHSPGLLRVLPLMVGDVVPNLITNPLGMFRTGEFIRRADLVHEVRAIARWGIPVTVAWADRDSLVPRSAFDELRKAAGVDGVVVGGSHAWLLADPDRFRELAISSLVDSGALTMPFEGRPRGSEAQSA